MDDLGLVSEDRLYVLCSQEDELDQASSFNPPPPRPLPYANSPPPRPPRLPLSSANPLPQPLSHIHPLLQLQLHQSNKIQSQSLSTELRLYGRKEVHCDPSAVYVSRLVEFLRGKMKVDRTCTYTDLLCIALHMIMMDTGYQPTAAVSSFFPTSDGCHSFSYLLPVCHTSCSSPSCHDLADLPAVPVTLTLKSEDRVNFKVRIKVRMRILHVTAQADLPDIDSESCHIDLRVTDYTIRDPIVWTTPSDVLIDTARLVVMVKDLLAHRLLTNIHRVLGITETGTFTSLLPELKYAVMRLLDARSLLSLSATCKLMQSLALNRVLWLSLLKKDLWMKGQLVRRPLDIMNIRKRTVLRLYPQLYMMDRLRNLKHPPNHRHTPLPPLLSNNRHGYRKRPLTPPPRSKYKYYSSFPYSLDRNTPILFSHRTNTMLTPAGNDNGYFEYYNDYSLRRSHSFPTLPSDKWQHYWQ